MGTKEENNRESGASLDGPESEYPRKPLTGVARVIAAAGHSMRGVVSTAKTEAAFRQELALFAFGVAVALALDVSAGWRAAMIGSLLLVLIVELLNTAVEWVVDDIGPHYRDLAKRAKDAGSAAVLASLILAGYIWIEALLARFLG